MTLLIVALIVGWLLIAVVAGVLVGRVFALNNDAPVDQTGPVQEIERY